MNLMSLFYFTELVKEMNFTRTAENLFITQQNLSQHIKRLETHYGVLLFIRRPKLVLTEEGKILYKAALQMLQIESKLLATFHPSNTGMRKLKVGINPFRATFCMPHILASFNQIWPDIPLSLVNNPSAVMEQAVTKGELDLFIGIQREMKPHLYSEKLLDDRVFLVLTEKVKQAFFKNKETWLKQTEQRGTDLLPFKDLPFFQLSKGFRLRKITDACFKTAGFNPKTEFEASSTDLLQSLLTDYLGISFVTEMRVNEIKTKHPNTSFLPLLSQGHYVKNPLFVVWHKERPVPEYMTDFIRITKEVFQMLAQK